MGVCVGVGGWVWVRACARVREVDNYNKKLKCMEMTSRNGIRSVF